MHFMQEIDIWAWIGIYIPWFCVVCNYSSLAFNKRRLGFYEKLHPIDYVAVIIHPCPKLSVGIDNNC